MINVNGLIIYDDIHPEDTQRKLFRRNLITYIFKD